MHGGDSVLRVNTFGVVVGGYKCNARCPYCISQYTFRKNSEFIDWMRFEKAKNLALRLGAYECLLTGVGEPTLYPDLLTEVLRKVGVDFPIVTLQTNGTLLDRMPLNLWRDIGLTTVAVSSVHWEREKNESIFGVRYPDLSSLVDIIHGAGLSVRLTVALVKGYIDTVEDMESMIDFARAHGVEQLTFGFVESMGIKEIRKYEIDAKERKKLVEYILGRGTEVYRFPQGVVLDVDGQNVCMRNCIENREKNNFRTLVFSGNHAYLSWNREGSVLF